VPKRHRLVAYFPDSVAETGASFAVHWRSAGEVSEVIGTPMDEQDPWLSMAQAAAILKVLGAAADPGSCDWRLHLRDED
jgi:hypothetical protein